MKKDKFNSKLREFARSLSPSTSEQELVSEIYQSFNDLFGTDNCIQIGSYPRFTSITPIHDLDILYITGEWNENEHTPSETLQRLYDQIINDHTSPVGYEKKVSLQIHSVTVEFLKNDEVKLSVDIVPAYSHLMNEFDQDMYKVPEIIREKDHDKRKDLQWDASNADAWIHSDPRGYIKVATEVGENSDFRKTVKLIKKWKNSLREKTRDSIKLKSFHLEQIVTEHFRNNKELTVFDGIFDFFVNLEENIEKPQITDRADSNKFIDEYLNDFSEEDKMKILQARDYFLITLENVEEDDDISLLFENVNFYKRYPSEMFLFDQKIPVLTEQTMCIVCENKTTNKILDAMGFVKRENHLSFKQFMPPENCWFKWKVKNDNNSPEPRGEISDHSTLNNPEKVAYVGNHYVECYAIRDDVCIAVSRQRVTNRNS